MFSVLIQAGAGEEERLAHTLASLVSAAVEGGLREVIVVAPAGVQGVAEVAEHAGCRLAADTGAAIAAAKGEWLLFLEPGARLREGWSESLRAHVAGRGGPARFTPEAAGWREIFRRIAGRRRPLALGLLIEKAKAAGSSAGSRKGFRSPRKLAGRIVPAS